MELVDAPGVWYIEVSSQTAPPSEQDKGHTIRGLAEVLPLQREGAASAGHGPGFDVGDLGARAAGRDDASSQSKRGHEAAKERHQLMDWAATHGAHPCTYSDGNPDGQSTWRSAFLCK